MKNTKPTEWTPRQRAILLSLCKGMSDKQTAAELGISIHTVRGHIRYMMRVRQVYTRPMLVWKWANRA